MNIVGLLELHFINTKFANYLDLYEYLLLLKVIWSKLYSDKSSSDKGTLFQLKNVINHTAVPSGVGTGGAGGAAAPPSLR